MHTGFKSPTTSLCPPVTDPTSEVSEVAVLIPNIQKNYGSTTSQMSFFHANEYFLTLSFTRGTWKD